MLLEAALAVARETDEAGILERILDSALAVTGARYAALAQYDSAGTAVRFLHRGMSPAVVSRIGRLPRGWGLLSVTALADGPVRTSDVEQHPSYVGLPSGHPRLTSFLGVPIRSGGRRHGNLYVAQDEGPSFDLSDEWSLTTLAAFAACAIDGAHLVTAERERGEALAQAAAAQERTRLRSQTLADVITAQEEERARVARDLHDEVGQSLTGVLLGLHLVETGLRTDPLDMEQVDRRIADVRSLIAQALTEVRQLASGLRPTVLDDLGLAAALERLVTDLTARDNIDIDLQQDYRQSTRQAQGHPGATQHDPSDGSPRLPAPVETVTYRVVQESLTNVVRHAGAQHVVVRITATQDRLSADVIDDGRGFDVSKHATSLGLRGMAERAALIGGAVRVTSRVGHGTTVALRVPLEGPQT
ncbi:GAF domain-containing sensor histidine kinase [Kineosporia sp. R_H_3]|uniref:GAF domain-containing sensor histidine kinase n=1 Tax=Kineosporia sp. R_H_3 TaxID=1961848 RepID=UPI0013047630|nr:GAF domain-containing sensor histidine kinase [Kineosporia sp. R_H_3]